MKSFIITFIVICAWIAAANSPTTAQATNQRYRNEIFNTVTVQKDVYYGEAVNLATGRHQILRLDLYQPAGDTALSRPAVIWIHGGRFRGGDKSDPNMTTLCNRLAKRGYVTASINYRLWFEGSPDIDTLKTVTQAYEDAKAAVRWFRRYAATLRIDTLRIAVGGASAGAITSLHATYEESEGKSGNPGYSSEVAACIDFWGGLWHDTVMEADEAPFLIIHGTVDTIVIFQEALKLQSRALAVGVPFELHALQGVGHKAWQFMENYIQWISDFLYTYVIVGLPTDVDDHASRIPRSIRLWQNHPNPFSLSMRPDLGGKPSTTIRYAMKEAGEARLQIFNVLGQEINILAHGWHEAGVYTKEFVATGLPEGLYFYRLQTPDAVMIRKMILMK